MLHEETSDSLLLHICMFIQVAIEPILSQAHCVLPHSITMRVYITRLVNYLSTCHFVYVYVSEKYFSSLFISEGEL